MHDLSDFKVLKKLGAQKKRKFGKTYLVQSNETNQKMVLKVVEHVGNFELPKEQLEAESEFSFKSDYLPEVIEFNSTSNESVLILKYKAGRPLDEYFYELKRKERIPFLKRFVSRLFPIFQELKKEGIAHCDIKPSNFIVDSDEHIHLIDFGLAIKCEETNHRKLVFPLGYAAPELVLNQLDLVNQQSDFYALGITIWRLFAGKLPLTHPNPSIFTNLQLNHPLPENENIRKELQAVLEKMTAKHAFRLPPNKLDSQEVKALLLEGMNNRPASIEEINEFIQVIPERRRWF